MTGTDDVKNVGQVLKWNNKTKLDFWKKGSSCNAIKGTDGSVFHPDLQTTEKLYLFNRDLCQSLPLGIFFYIFWGVFINDITYFLRFMTLTSPLLSILLNRLKE